MVTILFFAFFGISGLVFLALAFFLWIFTLPFDGDRRLNHYLSCFWATTYAWVYPGWKVRTTGRRNIEFGKPYVIVANHTSIADIVLMFGLFRQFKWLSKKDVFRYPILGWNMWMCRYIPLVRGQRESIARAMEKCRYWLRRGISIVMFPEGTRSKDGHLGEFKHGAFTLALECRVPVIPVVIHGGHALIPKHGRTFATKAELWVEVLPPVPVDGFDDVHQLTDHVRTIVAEALTRSQAPASNEANSMHVVGSG